MHSPSQKLRIHLLSCHYEYWREVMSCSIYNANESHMASSFPSYLRSNRLTPLTNNFHGFHHCGQATLIQVENSVRREIVPSDSIRVSLEEFSDVYTVECFRSCNRHAFRTFQRQLWMTIHVRFVPIKHSHTVPHPFIRNSSAAANFSILQHQLPEGNSRQPIKHPRNLDCVLLDEDFLSIREHPLRILLHGDECHPITLLLGVDKRILKKNNTLKQKSFNF